MVSKADYEPERLHSRQGTEKAIPQFFEEEFKTKTFEVDSVASTLEDGRRKLVLLKRKREERKKFEVPRPKVKSSP